MIWAPFQDRAAVLVSGGLDSSILLAQLAAHGVPLYPIYLRTGVVWESQELAALARFLPALGSTELEALVTLEVRLDDLYAGHWSVTGREPPPAGSVDQAVFLPGRNALLLVKALVWCQMHHIPRLALGVLGTSPFADASPEFFRSFQAAMNLGSERPTEIVCPFSTMQKRQIMELGRKFPLAETFSCISPVRSRHCGICNKCAERQEAFRASGIPDPTAYQYCTAPKP